MAETWMRVVIYHAPDAAEAADYLKSSTREALSLLEKQPGFKLGYWGANPDAGEMAAVTYWGTLEDIKAAAPVLDQLQAERERHGIKTVSARNMKLDAMPIPPQD
jgi:heme-degrading monooxygenase HmoA